ncbi:MAG TPA: ribosomal protein L13e [archaeon]|nr:ribosomal protein L13e [archaeon]
MSKLPEPLVKRINGKIRVSRGFSLSELVESGLTIDQARRLGLRIDKRRSTKWAENVAKLKELKLTIKPKTTKRTKKIKKENAKEKREE